MIPEWENLTGIDFESEPDGYLGFIYEIELDTGEYYVGRRQLWYRRGGHWVYTSFADYCSSSNVVKERRDSIVRRSILGVLSSKSALRFAEALAIIISGAYCCDPKGLNWNIDSCKGTIKLNDTDKQQLEHLRRYYADRWKSL
jgi:hypothetical protein